jgi:glycosyltransferase involved in cell wall biosynthesis
MKIAMIGHKRIPGREGGIEVVVEELTTRMVEKGHKVVAYNRKNKSVKNMKEYKGVKTINVPTIKTKSLDAIVYSFFASMRAAFGKYDVVHYHAIGPSLFLFIPKLFRKKIVVTVHGLNYKTPKWKGLGAKVIKLGEKITAKWANEIIVLSREQQKYFKEKYNRDTIYIPNGTTLKECLPAKNIKEKWGLDKNRYILFLSRIVPGKGLEHLIEAYKQIKTDLPLIVAGGTMFVDDFYDNIVNSAKEDGRIKFIGFVSGDDLIELYSNTNLFVFPSEAEGMPMCLLEALSYNAPCLVSDIPENTEVGKEYVQTFKVTDIENLKQKIEYCLKEKETIFSKNSREYIQDEFDWDTVVNKTIKLYEETRR